MSYIGKAPGFGIRNRYYYTATASQTLFDGADDNGQTLAYADSKYLDVYLNGVLLVAGTDYTATTLTSVTLTSGAAASDIVEIVAYDIFSIADTVSATSGGTFDGAVTFNSDINADGGTIKLDGNYPVGTSNVALGDTAMDGTSGSYNTAVGDGALSASGAFNFNTAVGFYALNANTGTSNTAMGRGALQSNTSGNYNTGIGHQALNVNLTGERNTALGYGALVANTASNNTAVGQGSSGANTTGVANSAFGMSSLNSNTTGDNNTAIGFEALLDNTTGALNVAVGLGASHENTTASNNTAVGTNSLYSNTTGANNVAMGRDALLSSTASNNTAVGYQSLYANTTGPNNTAVGGEALCSNTCGNNNVAVGFGALKGVSGCPATSTAVGTYALCSVTGITNGNQAFGAVSMIALTTGEYNNAHGQASLYCVTTGSQNTAIGHDAGFYLTTGSNNTYIGKGAYASSGGVSGEVVLASNNTTGKGTNTGFWNSSNVYNGANSSSWATTSDCRIKKNISDNTVGLDVISCICVRNFEYRTPEEITEVPSHAAVLKSGTQVGVIAQEIETILPDMVREESTGVKGVQPDNLTWYLVNAVKELKEKNDALEARLIALENAQP